MPASRRARAMTLAPRSCPSRPGFAMTTRFLAISDWASDDWHFFVLAPYVPQRIAHFPDGRIRAHGVEDGRHQIVARRAGGGAQTVQGAPHPIVVSGPSQSLEFRQLGVRCAFVDVEDLDRRFVILYVRVHADDRLVVPFDGLL